MKTANWLPRRMFSRKLQTEVILAGNIGYGRKAWNPKRCNQISPGDEETVMLGGNP